MSLTFIATSHRLLFKNMSCVCECACMWGMLHTLLSFVVQCVQWWGSDERYYIHHLAVNQPPTVKTHCRRPVLKPRPLMLLKAWPLVHFNCINIEHLACPNWTWTAPHWAPYLMSRHDSTDPYHYSSTTDTSSRTDTSENTTRTFTTTSCYLPNSPWLTLTRLCFVGTANIFLPLNRHNRWHPDAHSVQMFGTSGNLHLQRSSFHYQ